MAHFLAGVAAGATSAERQAKGAVTAKAAALATERLADAGIETMVGSLGDSYDALAETIIRLFKTELIHRRAPWRHAEALAFATLGVGRLNQPVGASSSLSAISLPAEAKARYYAQIAGQAMAA